MFIKYIIHRTKLQLLSISSLLIVYKYEKIYYTSIINLINIIDKVYLNGLCENFVSRVLNF